MVTQNLDGLHLHKDLGESHSPGSATDTGRGQSVIEIHGNGELYRCASLAPKGEAHLCEQIVGADGVFQCNVPVSFQGGGWPVMTSAPSCPVCAGPALPCALFFDESYGAHACFRFDECAHWLAEASTLVLVGTSNSVNICRMALRAAARGGSEVYNFNTEAMGATNGGAKALEVIGPCEATLPLLLEAVERRSGPGGRSY